MFTKIGSLHSVIGNNLHLTKFHIKILYFSYNLLVDHSFIWDEIHIKIGGDHGGGSFKECYQVCNTANPNNKENTLVFCVFEAKDLKQNLRTALTQYKAQIAQLQQMNWRFVSLRFIFERGSFNRNYS